MTVTNADDNAPRVLVTPPTVSTGWLAGLGTTFGLGALISSSCCAVPLALAGLGAGGAVFSGLELLANYRLYVLSTAAALLVASWAMFIRRRMVACGTDRSCAPEAPARRTAVLLSIGTAFVVLSLFWDALIEPIVFRWVR
jgi:mercuric ion transport protein